MKQPLTLPYSTGEQPKNYIGFIIRIRRIRTPDVAHDIANLALLTNNINIANLLKGIEYASLQRVKKSTMFQGVTVEVLTIN